MSPMNDEDLDRLADYAAGLLDPAQAAEVDRLVATDPTWSRAYADLAAAMPRLDAALSGLGPTRIPTDVAERLAAVLALRSPPADNRRLTDPAQVPARDARTTNVVELSTRRRWARRAAGLTAAAAVLAVIFGGITALSTVANHDRGSATSAVDAGSGFTGGPAPLSAAGPPVIRSSGIDYNPATLRALDAGTSEHADAMAPDPSRTGGRSAAKQGAAPVQPPGPVVPPASAPGLSRLLAPGALNGCLSAVMGRYGGRPVLVEYARYLGAPAVIVLLDTGGTRRVVVVGPECGMPGAGPDEQFTLVE